VDKFDPPRRGEIWWVLSPGRPDDPHQPRPAIVLSDDDRNQTFQHVLVVPIYSRGTPGPTHVPLPAGIGGQGGITRPSLAFCEEITTINREFLDMDQGPAGRLVPERLLDELVRGVRRAIGEIVVEPTDRGRP